MFVFKYGLFKVTSCTIKYSFKASILTIMIVLIISGLCSLFYYALKDDPPAPTKCVSFREIKKAPVKHRLSSDSSQVPKIVKKARVSSLKPSDKRHMSSKGGGSEHGREREGDPSALSKSCDLQVAPPPHASKIEWTKKEPQW